ncbi:MAG: hypothetical protein IPG97_03840 [Microthrixaceae bacterium]|jgi:hypothetical protein|nr:hypothetical protein [Microthrixaceae bacterium]
MDLTKLTLGDKVLAGSGLALFVFSFLPWFGVEGYGGGGNAWDVGFFTGILPTLIGLLLVGYVVVTKLADGVALPELPVPYPLVVLGLAGAAALLIVIRLLIGYEVGFGYDLDRKYGLFLATLAALGMAGGAFLKFQEEGGELPKGGGSGGQSGSQPPTPF